MGMLSEKYVHKREKKYYMGALSLAGVLQLISMIHPLIPDICVSIVLIFFSLSEKSICY